VEVLLTSSFTPTNVTTTSAPSACTWQGKNIAVHPSQQRSQHWISQNRRFSKNTDDNLVSESLTNNLLLPENSVHMYFNHAQLWNHAADSAWVACWLNWGVANRLCAWLPGKG